MIRSIIIGAGGIMLFIAMLSVAAINDSMIAGNCDWIYFLIVGLISSIIFMMVLDALFLDASKRKDKKND